MPLSLNEIKSRAMAFSKEWADDSSEDAEAKSFWDAFFNVFGISRHRVALFEEPVRKSDGRGGFIDLLWRGKLLVEHKSKGRDLDKALNQAKDYFDGLKDWDLPRYVLVSDFARFRLYDLEESGSQPVVEFPLEALHKNIKYFGFISGYESHSFEKEDPVNIKAAEKLGALHDQLKDVGYAGHELEVFLVRILFCLFADDTGIFGASQFREYLEQRTSEDGSDLGAKLSELFQTLNTPKEKRFKNLDEQLASFAYVNGLLFAEPLPVSAFTSDMRDALLDASALDWSRISPAIFGSLFQSIMDKKTRRDLGAHYTRETNILKALRPLFLDALREEFERVKDDVRRLTAFHKKLSSLRILDPACGCGNFLVIAYRELRLLELDVLRALQVGKSSGTLGFDLSHIVSVDVDQFYGIEVEEFPAQIAQVALWMMDHQMNIRVSEEFGEYFVRLPLSKAPNIVHCNALEIPWEKVADPATLSYIVGNPPFSGAMVMGDAQRADLGRVFSGVDGTGILDYVSAWYLTAARYLEKDPTKGRIRCAFVSTNSISKGEQVGVLWRALLPMGVKIDFAHRTFKWSSEARGTAAVHCVIMGFGLGDSGRPKTLFDYESPEAEPQASIATNINPYLVEAPDTLLENRSAPICNVPPMKFGNMPRDDGALLLTDAEKEELIASEPGAAPFIQPFISAKEFLNSEKRWCLWLQGADPATLRKLPRVMSRIEHVQSFRRASKAATTRALAATPTLFAQIAQPTTDYLLVPRHSSENRRYIPMGFFSSRDIVADSCLFVPDATPYHFGVMMSEMHMAWVRYTCGRLESRYRYSKDIVYNNFPWPTPTDAQKTKIEECAHAVLKARAATPTATLVDLYDPVAMPPELVKAHQALDRAVDEAYGKRGLQSEAARVAFLFTKYQEIVAPMARLMESASTPRRRARNRRADTV